MSVKTFGYWNNPNWARWFGTNYGACIAMRSEMPENGTILQITLRLARYPGHLPDVWGAIWNRNTGALLTKSEASQRPSVTYESGNPASTEMMYFPMEQVAIAAGTPLWIGLARNNSASKAVYFASRSSVSGRTIDYQNIARTTPGNFTEVTNSFSNEALLIEVMYVTGGEVKIWNGSAWISKGVKIWTGPQWAPKPVKIWNGSQWVDSKS